MPELLAPALLSVLANWRCPALAVALTAPTRGRLLNFRRRAVTGGDEVECRVELTGANGAKAVAQSLVRRFGAGRPRVVYYNVSVEWFAAGAIQSSALCHYVYRE